MKRMTIAVLALAVAAALVASSGTESKWTVTKGSTSVATVTLLTSSVGKRAEWKSGSAAPIIFLESKGQTWVRQTGGDVELASYNGAEEKDVVASLMSNDPESSKTFKVSSDGKSYTVTRTSFAPSNADASNFAVRPKKGAASTMARLSGDLFGSSSSGVSATAGGRGVGNSGMKLKDGGDYDAVAKLENRDKTWSAKMDAALADFQKSGKVGKERQ